MKKEKRRKDVEKDRDSHIRGTNFGVLLHSLLFHCKSSTIKKNFIQMKWNKHMWNFIFSWNGY